MRKSERPKILRQQRMDRARKAAEAQRTEAARRRVSRARNALSGTAFGQQAGSPLQKLERPAKRAVTKAQQRAPERPAPTLPVYKNPTRREREAVQSAVNRFLDRASGKNLQQRLSIMDEVESDPRLRARVGTPTRAALAAERDAIISDPRLRRQLATAQQGNARLGRSQATRGRHTMVAGVDLSSLADTVMGATSLDTPSAGNQWIKGIGRDLKTLATFLPVVGWETAQGTLEAAKTIPGVGDALEVADKLPVTRNLVPEGEGTERLGRLAQGVGEGIMDMGPTRLVRAAAAPLTRDTTSGQLNEFAENFRTNPLLSVLDFYAGAGALGRAAGGTARTLGKQGGGPVQQRLADIGSTVRDPIAITDEAGSTLIRQRATSASTVSKAVQKAADRRRGYVLDKRTGKPVMVEDARSSKPLPLRTATTREQKKYQRQYANFAADRANALERFVRDEAQRVETNAVTGAQGRKAPVQRVRNAPRGVLAVVPNMAIRGLIANEKTVREDLVKARDHWAKQLDADAAKPQGEKTYRRPGERETAEDNVKAIDRILASPRLMKRAEGLVARGYDQARLLNQTEREIKDVGGTAKPQRTERAALMNWAQAQMGARRVEVSEHQRMETDARKAEQVALEKHGADSPEFKQARAQRIAVSGKDPVRVEAHETARTAYAKAKEAEKVALARARRLRQSRDRLLNDRSPEGTRKRQRRTELMEQADKEAREARRAKQKAQKELRKNPAPKAEAGLRREDGTYLSNDDIRKDIETKRGKGSADTVAYLPDRPSARGARAYHKQMDPNSRPLLDSDAAGRTGAAFAKGAISLQRQVVTDEFVHKATTLSKIRSIDRIIADGGMRRPDGKLLTGKQGLELKAQLGDEWVPVRAFGAKLSVDLQDFIKEALQDPRKMQDLGDKLLNDRVVTDANYKGAKNVVMMPKAVMEQLGEHLARAGKIERFLQALNRPFRAAVLAQPRWLTGNFVEPFFVRLTASGSGLNVAGMYLDIRAARRVLKRMENSPDPKVRSVAKEIRAQQLGGLFLGRLGQTNKRGIEDFESLAKVIEKLPPKARAAFLGALPVIRSAKDVFYWPVEQIFRANRQLIEKWMQEAALGQSIRRDLREFYGSWIEANKLGQEALAQAEKGLMNTPTQWRFMERQYELLGQYGGWNPTLRAATQGPFPFIPWVMNAVRFSMWTLPAHHPIKTAVAMHAAAIIEDAWAADHEEAFGTLKYAARTSDGGYVDFSRYTPWSFNQEIIEGFAAGKPLEALTSQFIPALQGPIKASEGKDPFGRPLAGPEGKLNEEGNLKGSAAAGVVANQLFEALAPYVSSVRRISEGGSTGYSTSSIFDIDKKPDTDYGRSGAGRVLDPFSTTYLSPPDESFQSEMDAFYDEGRVRSQRQTSRPMNPAQARARRIAGASTVRRGDVMAARARRLAREAAGK